MTVYKTVDAYIAAQPAEVQAALEKVRQAIKSILPEDAEETISYAMPAFKYYGLLVAYAGWKQHIGFYPCSSSTLKDFKEELKGYKASKGTIQFPLDRAIPLGLIKKIIKVRLKENKEKQKGKELAKRSK